MSTDKYTVSLKTIITDEVTLEIIAKSSEDAKEKAYGWVGHDEPDMKSIDSKLQYMDVEIEVEGMEEL